jgi:HNH endonuclease
MGVEKYSDLSEFAELYELIATAKKKPKVFGPYRNKADRSFVILLWPDGTRKTMSEARWLYQQHHGDIPGHMTVDHINRDRNDNRMENLQLLPRSDHSAADTRRVKMVKFRCLMCRKKVERSPRLIRDKSSKGKVSQFCGRQCAGRYAREVQLGLREKAPVPKPPKSKYYRRDKVVAMADYLLTKYGELIAETNDIDPTND